MTYILTHPGSAHKDDFLACSVLASEYSIPIVRRDPTDDEVADPNVFVVDIGGSHDPECLNFDHHQFPADYPPACSLSLVLQHLGVYEDALRFCPWMKTAEWLDARGARQTADWLNVDPFVVAQLSSPIDHSLLRYFSQETELQPDHALWQMMARIGGDLLTYLRTLRSQLNELKELVEVWQVDGLEFCVLPRQEGLSPELSNALSAYVRTLDRDIAGTVSPDTRGTGYGLRRFDDDARLDFIRIADEPDVHFAHKQGFIAKTSATDPERLQQLLSAAVC